jgi:hypothetical protein
VRSKTGKTSFWVGVAGVHDRRVAARQKKDSTEVMRTRQVVAQNKLALTICALLAAVGFIGWLTTL